MSASDTRARSRVEVGSWLAALVLAAIVLAALGYQARDPDSRLYAQISARMAEEPRAGWIAPTFPPGWYMNGLFREHPMGIHLLPALLARLGYPAAQAPYLANALYQMLSLVLLVRLAATVAQSLEARSLGWIVQLLPIAFTYRIRGNHEQAVLLFLLLALWGLERAQTRRRFGLAVVAGLVGLLLVKGVFVLMGIAACALWLLVRRGVDQGPHPWAGAGWLLAAALAVLASAYLYEEAYLRATGEPFWSVYLGRQYTVAAVDQSAAGLAQKAYNLVWYLARVVWFAFPWSLTLLAALSWKRPLARTAEASGARKGVLFAVLLTALYLGAFSLSDRRADRYIFPVYFAVGAAGAVAALRSSARFHALARRLDGAWVPAAVWIAGFALHIAGGRLGLPTVKVWGPDS